MKIHWSRIRNPLFFVLFVFIAYFSVRYVYFLFNKDNIEEIDFLIFIATAALAWIAWYEFNRSNILTGNEFLLFISNRWGSKEVIKARQIIQEFFVIYYRGDNSASKGEFSSSINEVSKNVIELSRKSKGDGERFIYLLNLLDF